MLWSACKSMQTDQSSLSTWRNLWSLATYWAQAKTLIRLGRCPGWSESSLGTQFILWVLSCCGSYNILLLFTYLCCEFAFWQIKVLAGSCLQHSMKIQICMFLWIYKWATSWGNPFMPYATTNGLDQPVHPRSLIGAFVIHCLDSIISVVSICEISIL